MNKRVSLHRRGLLAGLSAVLAVPSLAFGAAVADSARRPARPTVHLERAVLLGAGWAGARIVAVGERGVIALSDDGAKTWRQARAVPVSVTLTAVQFVDDRHGWAVGHGGVVLHTADAGESWVQQLDGVRAARLALEAAQAEAGRAGADEAAAARRLKDAQLLVDDGPDKPFLDLRFSDARNGLVVGAYNLCFATSDGGRSWRPLMDRLPNPRALHLYAVRRQGELVLVAGEQGLLMRSTDGGASFTALKSPYEGSWFTLALQPDGAVLAAGMRGQVWSSGDRGESWTRLEGAPPVSFVHAAPGERGMLLANQAGQFFEVPDQGTTLRALPLRPLPPLTHALPLGAGGLLALSLQGPIPLQLSKDDRVSSRIPVSGAAK
ncbi:WD40/YVTN/BNR-like repeat-containing protein [Caldimonas tepidiphila]|uniref:WD40/YVTN/BNR-like repeat-containing protein n=1 Tax=Caldimonas tepidiphila TaxID=2315841 RepID=UPI00196A9E5B|nr:YCF48-related protein [Caldimonas tepidiphila]